MRTRTKWTIAGGAAALVITPVVAVYGSPTMVDSSEQRGLVIDAEAANRARSERVTPTPTPSPTTKATTEPTADSSAEAEPTGKKTVSAVSPISPKSPKSPDTPG